MENVFLHTAGTWAQGVVLSHMLIVVCQLLFLVSAVADGNFRS